MTVTALTLIGPWVLFGDEIVSESSVEVTGASVVFGVHSLVALTLLAWALLRRGSASHRHDYWIITGTVALSMVRRMIPLVIPQPMTSPGFFSCRLLW